MAVAVIMPKAGMSMERGTIIRWLKKEGDSIRRGEPLLEIETDKVAMEVEAEADGVLLAITRRDGEEVPVTETIGYIGKPGETVVSEAESKTTEPSAAAPSLPATAPAAAARSGRPAATPLARTLARSRGIDLAGIAPSGVHGEIKARDVLDSGRSTVKASPVARAVAGLEGVDLASIRGTGRAGKIMKHDVLAAAPPPAAMEPPAASRDGEVQPMSSLRRTIAARMAESHRTVPPVTLHAEADVTRLLALKQAIAEQTARRYTLTDFLLRATVVAIADHPAIMSQLAPNGESIHLPTTVHLGIAVSADDALIVPVIRNAGRLSFESLAAEAHALIERTRSRALRPDDVGGASFTVTNLGMYGIVSFTPMINPPEGAILGVGTVRSSLELDGGSVVERKKIFLSLTIDHRIIDGALGAIFLSRLREALEKPMQLLA